MSVFFVADTHFGHANIILYTNRPFVDKSKDLDDNGRWISHEVAALRVREMDETLITNWNAVIRAEDIVYHLGDFAFGDAERYFRRLNGRIHWVHGNHDKGTWKIRANFASHAPMMQIKVALSDRTQDITLCHYAMRIWNKSHYGAWCLYGHSHKSLEGEPWGKSMDVGVDCNNYYPFSLSQVASILDARQIHAIDHHIAKEHNEELYNDIT
jgi:calcineurin-like phosphoesterase family protein